MRIAILGTGLIGGSLGLALRELPEVEWITGFDRDPGTAEAAVTRGAIHGAAASASAAVQGADVVFVATPVGAIASTVAECLDGLSDAAIVTDVGSTKSRVVLEIESFLASRPAVTFIGGHPMAGSEQEGIEAARPDLFAGAWWVLTPGDAVDPASYRSLHRLLSAIGARVMALEAGRHDELMAVISHIPQLTATALMNLAAEKGREHGGLLALAAGGFRDVTRVAASNPDLWVEICLENREAISAEIEEFADRLLTFKKHLRDGDTQAIRRELLTARDARQTLGKKPVSGDMFELHIEIPDRPGVLAEVTRLIGERGVNIEDIGIQHATEGGRGVLRVSILGDDESKDIESLLSTQGFITQRLQL